MFTDVLDGVFGFATGFITDVLAWLDGAFGFATDVVELLGDVLDYATDLGFTTDVLALMDGAFGFSTDVFSFATDALTLLDGVFDFTTDVLALLDVTAKSAMKTSPPQKKTAIQY